MEHFGTVSIVKKIFLKLNPLLWRGQGEASDKTVSVFYSNPFCKFVNTVLYKYSPRKTKLPHQNSWVITYPYRLA